MKGWLVWPERMTWPGSGSGQSGVFPSSPGPLYIPCLPSSCGCPRPLSQVWGKSCRPSPPLGFDHLSCAFLEGGSQEMEQRVPPAAACLPVMAGLAPILRFCPPIPSGPQCGDVI